jgi:hypothetical protein
MQMEAQLQMQMMAAQGQMQQAQQAPQGQGQPPYPGQMPGGGNGVPRGQAYNPNMGGQPAAMSNPNVTRENVTGVTRTGQPIEEGIV